VIKAEKLDNLIPEILMESKHLYLILLDVEGNVLNSNKIFSDVAPNSINQALVSYLSTKSKISFSEILYELISTPKQKKSLLLDFIIGESQIGIWWEFSIVTSPEMDFLGVMGMGVGPEFQLLLNQYPCKNLSELLSFSKFTLNDEFQVIETENAINNLLGIDERTILGKKIFQSLLLPINPVYQEKINQFNRAKHACILHLIDPENQKEYSGLLMSSKNETHLLILPKTIVSNNNSLKKPFTEEQLSMLPGTIWIVDQELKLIQQNNFGSTLSKAWNGIAFEENDIFYFTQHLGKFSNLINKVKYCLSSGNSIELDIQAKSNSLELVFWKVNVKAIKDSNGNSVAALIQVFDNSVWGKKILELQSENHLLKELALKPSHILRSPLSSMLGLLDLIDPKQLNQENLKYFSYLKPLARELDEVIRSNAKKVSVFD
jgi:hypothetical protein